MLYSASNVKHNLENFREEMSIVFTHVFPQVWDIFTHYLYDHIFIRTLFLLSPGPPMTAAATTPSMGSLRRVVSLAENVDGQALFHLYYMTSSACQKNKNNY